VISVYLFLPSVYVYFYIDSGSASGLLKNLL